MEIMTGMSNLMEPVSRGVKPPAKGSESVTKGSDSSSFSSVLDVSRKNNEDQSVKAKTTSDSYSNSKENFKSSLSSENKEASQEQNEFDSESESESQVKSTSKQKKQVVEEPEANAYEATNMTNPEIQSDIPAKKGEFNFVEDKVFNQIPPSSVSSEQKMTLGEMSDRSEVKKLSQTIDSLGYKIDEVVDPLSRRVAIQSFMRKMENEFGVKPIDMVVAFNNLSVEELVSPPQDTVPMVVQQFGLNSADEAKATIYFNQMLAKTEAASLAEYLKGSERQLSLEVLSQTELNKNEMNASVDKMLNQFFINPKEQTNQKGDQPQQKAELLASGAVAGGIKAQSVGSAVEPGALVQNPFTAPLASEVPMAQPTSSSGSAGIRSFEDMMGQLRLNMNQAKQSSQVSLNSASESLNSPSFLKNSSQSEFSKEGSLGSDSDFTLLAEDVSVDSDSLSDMDLSGFEGQLRSEGTKANQAPSVDKASMMMAAEPTETQDADNVREIITHSKALIKQGGGEMNIRLNPKELGEITLKVGVNEGRVSVDLVTESNHAKKLIEKGLGELKATLASHKLDVGQIKVDIGNNLSQDLDQQQGQAERRFAEQFLQDFKQGNQQFRDSFGFGRTVKTGNQLLDDRDTNIIDAVAKKKKSGSNRLDLVA